MKVSFSILFLLFIQYSFGQYSIITPGGTELANKSELNRISIPKLSSANILRLTSPQKGDLVFDLDINCLKIYNGNSWNCLVENSNDNFMLSKKMQLSISMGYGNNTPYNRGYLYLEQITTDANNNIYLAGKIVGPYTLKAKSDTYGVYEVSIYGPSMRTSGQKIIPNFNGAGIVLKISNDGYVLWSKIFVKKEANPYVYSPADFFSNINDILVVNNNLYVTGSFNYGITIDNTDFSATTKADGFFTKLDLATGQSTWVRQIDGAGLNKKLSTDNTNIYIGGTYDQSTITLKGNNTTISMNNQGLSDIFIGKYDASGELLVASSIGGTDSESLIDISQNNILGTAGNFTGGANNFSSLGSGTFLLNFNQNLSFIEVKRFTGNITPTMFFGNSYFAGTYTGQVQMGQTKSLGGTGTFFAMYDYISSDPKYLFTSDIGLTNVTYDGTNLYGIGLFKNLDKFMGIPLKCGGETDIVLSNFVLNKQNSFSPSLNFNGYTTTTEGYNKSNVLMTKISDSIFIFVANGKYDLTGNLIQSLAMYKY